MVASVARLPEATNPENVPDFHKRVRDVLLHGCFIVWAYSEAMNMLQLPKYSGSYPGNSQ